MGRLLAAGIGIRVVAALVLVLGPWTNTPEELVGWDVERFQAIADIDGRPWVDAEVEYPPGSVAVIDALARPGVVGTHRVLVLASLAVDLAVAAAVGALGGRRAATAYLILGLPLVPMGLLRFDLWAAMAAVLGLAALRQRRPAAFALFTVAGALIKVWPALLVAGAAALGRWRAVGAAVGLGAVAGVAWLGWTGWSTDAVEQVLSMRGATGWHAESVAGSIEALRTGAEPTLQQNAYRLGTLDERVVLAGRALTVAVVGLAVGLGLRATRRLPESAPAPTAEADTAPADATGAEITTPETTTPADPITSEITTAAVDAGSDADLEVVALVLVAAVAALIVTSPLLSPQFLLWLTPWAALAPRRPAWTFRTVDPGTPLAGPWPLVWVCTFLATALTGGVLTAFGPSGVAEQQAAILLLVRDAALVAAVLVALVGLARSGRPEDALGHGGPGPRPAGADAQVGHVADEAGGLAD
ncbi:MAG: hypothetical protein AAGA59_07635 [Actinomycetota bacterium]